MKREPTDTPPERSGSYQPSDRANSPTPHTPKKVKTESKPSSPSKPPGKTPRKAKDGPEENGTWTAEKRLFIMEKVLDIGCRSVDVGTLAQECGLSRKQISNQLAKGRAGSMRDRALKAVCTD